MSTKIYTKNGDHGKTSLLGGKPQPKSSPQIKAYGSVDELNSCLGIAATYIRTDSKAAAKLKHLLAQIEKIQNELFNIGGQLACATLDWRSKVPTVDETHIQHLENEIDCYQSELAPLNQFILPGGTMLAAYLHHARTVCRRAERDIVDAYEAGLEEDAVILTYINRLSDYLFVVARAANHFAQTADVPWKK
jgi:cob(I)alamin adenosyltransferase